MRQANYSTTLNLNEEENERMGVLKDNGVMKFNLKQVFQLGLVEAEKLLKYAKEKGQEG